jgi:hypothetical protein
VRFNVTKLPIAEVSTRSQPGEPGIRLLFTSAHDIFSKDAETGQQGMVFGKDLLEDIAAARASEFTELKQLLCVTLDNKPEAGHLEWLHAAVTVLTGSCHYE